MEKNLTTSELRLGNYVYGQSESEANGADILHWTLHNYKPYEDGMNMVWRNINPDIDTLHTSEELTEIFKTRKNK